MHPCPHVPVQDSESDAAWSGLHPARGFARHSWAGRASAGSWKRVQSMYDGMCLQGRTWNATRGMDIGACHAARTVGERLTCIDICTQAAGARFLRMMRTTRRTGSW